MQNLKETIDILPVRALKDNYCYLLHRRGSPIAIVIDPSEAAPVERALRSRGWALGLILNTHHHHDHVGGNLDLQRSFDAPIWCSEEDLDRVPGAERGLHDGELFQFDDMNFETLEIPGHTRGQIAFALRGTGPKPTGVTDVFVGDTLFAMGCGRLFEGTPEEMWASLSKLMELPQTAHLHFGHEYTDRNAEFARIMEPSNLKITERLKQAQAALSRSDIVPAPTLADERLVNPFLRPDSPEIRARLSLEGASNVEVFAKLREMRNSF